MPYNGYMNRKKRTDRNHVIYQLTCVATGETYIGLTVMRGQAKKKSVNIRFQQHQYRSKVQDHAWALHNALRTHANWMGSVLEVVRGKVAAHSRERELIFIHNPKLNTQ